MSGDSEMTKPNGWTGGPGERTWTKGPWEVTYDKNGTVRIGPSHNCTVAVVWFAPYGDSDANARLIAAAPSLYEALAGYMAAVENMNQSMRDGLNVHGAMSALVGWEDIARAALQRAEGEGA